MSDNTSVYEVIQAQHVECGEMLENVIQEEEELQTQLKHINAHEDIIKNSLESCKYELSVEESLENIKESTEIVK